MKIDIILAWPGPSQFPANSNHFLIENWWDSGLAWSGPFSVEFSSFSIWKLIRFWLGLALTNFLQILIIYTCTTLTVHACAAVIVHACAIVIVHTCAIVIVHACAVVIAYACATYRIPVVQIWFANFKTTSSSKNVLNLNQKHHSKIYSNATDFDFQKLFQTLKHWKTNGFLMLAMKNHCKT